MPVKLPVIGFLGSYHVTGEVCSPSGVTNDSIQLLIPGGTYSSTYWDFPISGYSYVDYMTQHGQSVLALNLVNRGTSSRIPSALVTVPLQASVIHQAISMLRSGAVDGTKYTKVTLVGHSLGSLETVEEVVTYHDVDGLVLTGFSHNLQVPFVAAIATGLFVPAQLSQTLSDRPLGDLTTQDGHRGDWFQDAGNTTAAVIQADDETKDVVSAGELATIAGPYALPETNLIKVPVLVSNGSHDKALGCSPLGPCANSADLYATEHQRFSSAASFSTFVLPGAGHDISLANNSELFYANTLAWTAQNVG